jgi:uncharacterized repeat protein (TIGR01451 family)
MTVPIRIARSLAAVVALLAIMAPPAAAQLDVARPGSTLGGAVPQPDQGPQPGCITEGFDDILNLPGWFIQNNSQPIGTLSWFQGNAAVFPAHSGAPTSYIAVNFNSGGMVATISNWLLTPELDLSAIDTMTFFTRAVAASTFPDRLQVRYSTNGPSTNVGTLATDVGDFTNLALDINPTLMVGGYPQVFTQFTLTGAEINAPGTGRVAFRYFVTNGGPAGSNSDYIGIDTFEFCELQEADLAIVKTADETEVAPGDTLVYTLTVSNAGPADATNVVVTDPLPAGVTYVSDDCGGMNTPPWTWNVGTLTAGGPGATCNITVTVDADATGLIDNTATVAADNADPVTANNAGTAQVEVGQSVLEIPTLSQVGLALLVLVLAAASLVLMRRRLQRG